MDSSRRKIVGFIIFACVGMIACGIRIYFDNHSKPAVVYLTAESSDSKITNPGEPNDTDPSHIDNMTGVASNITDHSPSSDGFIPIYLCGAVRNPGVYYVLEGSFLFELLETAGGVLPEAATDHINMVMKFSEPVSVYVPAGSDLPADQFVHADISNSSFLRIGSDCYIWGQGASYILGPQSDGEGADKININTAEERELMSLSGIGEVTAQAIIRYRTENGLFSKIEDIMKVPGIKQGRFDAIKDCIVVR